MKLRQWRFTMSLQKVFFAPALVMNGLEKRMEMVDSINI